MKLFDFKKNKDYTIIVGCGSLGANIANALSNEEENVLIMDQNSGAFRRLASNFGGLSVTADGTNLDKLKEANIQDASAVIAVTNDDNTNIMIALIAREMFGVARVIARLYDPECESVYQQFGINTICPSALSAKEIDKLLDRDSEKEEIS